jgi:hypothetical protein
MVSVLASSAIYCGYELWSCQTKEYKIGNMWIVNGRQKTNDGRQVMVKAHIAFGKVSYM